MARILFVTWAGGGNLAPALGIASALERRGHEVEFLGHAVQEPALRGRGFAFRAFQHGVPWPPTAPPDPAGPPPTFAVFTDAGLGDDVAQALARERADALLVDHLLWGVLRTAPGLGIPYATLVHTLFGQQHETWSRGRGAELARLRGYDPVALWRASDAVLIATLRELDPAPEPAVPANAVFTGPAWQGRPAPASPGREPLVLVSLSTMRQEGQAEALQRILDALGTLPVRGLVTTGAAVDPGLLRAPANVEVRAFAPHEEVMPRASLVISHAGHSTAMAALAHDLPMLLLPMFMLGDQPVVASILEARGAALTLSKDSEAGSVRDAVQRLLVDPSFREAAAVLGALIRRRDGAEVAADTLERLVRSARPAAAG